MCVSVVCVRGGVEGISSKNTAEDKTSKVKGLNTVGQAKSVKAFCQIFSYFLIYKLSLNFKSILARQLQNVALP